MFSYWKCRLELYRLDYRVQTIFREARERYSWPQNIFGKCKFVIYSAILWPIIYILMYSLCIVYDVTHCTDRCIVIHPSNKIIFILFKNIFCFNRLDNKIDELCILWLLFEFYSINTFEIAEKENIIKNLLNNILLSIPFNEIEFRAMFVMKIL